VIADLIAALNEDPDRIDDGLKQKINELGMGDWVIDVEKAQKAFQLSRQLDIRPSL
jgi:hypothetical protein